MVERLGLRGHRRLLSTFNEPNKSDDRGLRGRLESMGQHYGRLAVHREQARNLHRNWLQKPRGK
jgi:hypothetical protein